MTTELRTTRYQHGGWCEQEYLDGKLHGRWTVFFANGLKKWERQYSNGRQEGYEREWDTTGRLIEEKWYHLGELHGRWKVWDDAGQLEVIGDFVNGYKIERLERAANPDFNTAIKPYWGMEPEDCEEQIETILEGMARKTVQMRKLPHPRIDLSQAGSFWNHVNVLGVDEQWPCHDGLPLFPILQLNCREIPLADNPLREFSFVTLFAASCGAPEHLGEDIVVRAYRPADQVIALPQPACAPLESPSQLGFSNESRSYPDENDLPPGLRAYLEDSGDKYGVLNQDDGLKSRIGGWPGWLQFPSISGFGRFAFQVDSLDVENWRCGDSTIHYFFLSDDGGRFDWSQEMC